jgi:hypothetical protein
MAAAPDNLVCFAQVFSSALTLRSGTVISVAYFGELDEGRAAIRPLTEGVVPDAEGVRPMYYPELQEIFGRVPFGLRNYWSGRFLRELPGDAIELVASAFDDPDARGGVLLEPLHGAAARVAPEATAFAGREASFNATFIGIWTDPSDDERWISSARSFSGGLAPWSIGGGYVNYASEATGDSLDTAFGAARLQRLRDVKREYDPENRFRFNHNITPQ